MGNCCGDNVCFDGASRQYRRALWWVIVINAVMFLVEMTAGALAGSQALQADALDFLGDTATYSLSLWVLGRPLSTRATAALFKGFTLAAMGIWVLGFTLYNSLVLGVPSAEVMGVVGALALAANLAAVVILMRYRDGDANVRSVWLCSRNDAVGNVAVMVAALLVGLTGTAWPDILVAVLMASLFLRSATQIIRQAMRERRETARSEERRVG